MKKIKTLTLLSSTLAILAVTISLFTNNDFVANASIKKSTSSGYEINLNKDKNKFHSTTGSTKVSGATQVKTELDNDVNFVYSNIIGGGTSTWHVVSGDDGYFYNSDPINGLKSITISFKTDSKSFKLYYSETSTFTEAKSSSFISSTSVATTFDFNSYKPNYFKFTNTSGGNINISSIVLTYSCVSDFSTINVSSSDTSKGNVSESSGTYRNGTSITLTATPRTGYHFAGWYENEILISNEATYSFNISYDTNYVGVFEGDAYSVTITNANPSYGLVSGEGIYRVGDQVTLTASPNDGYSFDGWYKDSLSISSSLTYSFVMPNDNVSYTAKFKIVTYSITYELDGGENDPANPSSYTVETNDITLANPSKIGYAFVKWTDQNGNTVSKIKTGSFGDLILTANWTIKYYQLNVTSENETQGTVSGTGSYAYGSEITVAATPKEGYDFLGWYNDDNKVSSDKEYTFVVSNDTSLLGKFTKIYNIYLESDDTSKGTVTGPSTGIAGLDITVTAEGNTIFDYFDYWYDEDFNEVSYDSTYTFTMPEHDVYLTAAFVTDNTKIIYGEYPQSLVKDTSLISALDAISTTDSKGYKTYNGDKYLQYSGKQYTDNDGKIVSAGEHYYKVEPIEWKVLSTDSSSAFVTTKCILDQQIYGEYYSGTKSKTDYQGNTATVYANNYKYSDLRTFLNTTFLNQAFDDTFKILTTKVDNSAATTNSSPNPCACENTFDKVFALSYKDLTNASYGFSSGMDDHDIARQCKTSEYARARGAGYSTVSSDLYNGTYWTRSPYGDNFYYAWGVRNDGYIYVNDVSFSDYGVLPAMNISIA